MIDVPQEVAEALIDSHRFISARVLLEQLPNTFVDITSYIIAFDTIESVSEGSLPYGQITFNELGITVDNNQKEFLLNNINSPFYGYLVPGKRIQIIYDIYYNSGQNIHSITLGYFYVDMWKASMESNEATVVAYDTLYQKSTKPLKSLPMAESIKIEEAFSKLLRVNGIDVNEYKIVGHIGLVLKYWWPQGDTLADALQSLAEIGGVNIFCDKFGIITIMPISRISNTVMDLDDNHIVISTSASPSYKESYTVADIKYKAFNYLEIKEVINVDTDITVPGNMRSVRSFDCNVAPILDIICAATYGSDNIDILDFTLEDADTVEVTFYNQSSSPTTFGARLTGRVISTVDKHYISDTDPNATNVLQINCPYIVEEQSVIELATQLKTLYKGVLTSMTITVRALPTLELYDKVLYTSTYLGVDQEFYITKLTYDYSEGLMGTIELSAALTNKPEERVFVSPGLSIGLGGNK